MLSRRDMILGGLTALGARRPFDVRELGITAGVEDRAAETRQRIQALLDSQRDRPVLIPEGVWWIDSALLPRSGAEIVCRGVIKAASTFEGVGARGGLVAIRHAQNVSWRGGVLDANGVRISEGMNPLAISAPQADKAGRTRNVEVLDLEIRGARTDPARKAGAGGGKGFTVQFGCEDITLRLRVIDCDYVGSLEGRVAADGATRGVHLDIEAEDCRHGLWLHGTSGGRKYLQAQGRVRMKNSGPPPSPEACAAGVFDLDVNGRRC